MSHSIQYIKISFLWLKCLLDCTQFVTPSLLNVFTDEQSHAEMDITGLKSSVGGGGSVGI